MSTNYPLATPPEEPKKDSKNLIIALLAIGILGTWGYFLWDKNNSNKEIDKLTTENYIADSSYNELDVTYKAALSRLDSLTVNNNELEGKLTERNSEIKDLRTQIDGYMKKQKLSDAEKKKAAALIEELNTKINGLEEEVARLTSENQQLNTTVNKLNTDLETTTTAKKQLETKVDIASTLNASNIAIAAVNERRNGKEKETSRAKRADKLIISFDVENRIANSGNTDIFVCITDPDGTAVSLDGQGSGRFQTREDGEKLFSAKVDVVYEAGKKKHVEFAWKQQPNPYKKGNYKIEIYHNGFKIGDGIRPLK
ncbi:MAG: hypothetical protein ACKO6K_02835 [Chitinophagaceae bacterium]